MNTSMPDAGRSRNQVWILIAVFVLPLLLAFYLYYGGAWRPGGRTNQGDLIDPPRPLPELALTSATGEALPEDLLRGRWTLVYVGDGACDARCEEALTLIRQTRLALNDDIPRVQRVFLASPSCCNRDYLDTQHPGLVVVDAAAAGGAELLGHFPGAERGGAGLIYIVDPLGNLMMSYGADAPPKGLLEDMRKLLKLSHIG
jgi:hypothetical protein